VRLLRSEIYIAMDAMQYLRGNHRRLKSSSAIAKYLKCNCSYVRNIMRRLVDAHIVISVPGRTGGYLPGSNATSVYDLSVALGLVEPDKLMPLDGEVADALKKVII